MAEAKGLTTAIVSIVGKLDPSVQKSVDKATKGMKGLKLATVATATAIGASVAGATKYLLDLGNEMDGAYDTIRIGTGATGKTLNGLKKDFEKVLQSVPTSSENASQAIADLNTRLGLSGKNLQDVAKSAIYLSENLGAGDLTTVIEKSSRAFQAWGVKEEEMTGKMDYLFKVSQSTGIGFNELAEKTQKYGATFQSLGYDFESASTLIGSLTKNGADVDSVLAGMRTSLGKLTAQGLSASEGFEMYYSKIKDAKTETEAMSIASEIFGTKNGALMAKSIRDGKLACAALTAELEGSSETIAGASEDTMDYAEKMQLMKNKMKVALAPLANTVFDSVNALMPVIEKGFGVLTKIISKVGGALPNIIPKISAVAEKVIGVIESVTPSIMKVVGGITSGFSAMSPIINSLFTFAFSTVADLFDSIKSIIGTVINVAGQVIPMISNVIVKLLPVIQNVVKIITSLFKKLVDSLLPVINNIITAIMPVIQKVLNMATSLIENVLGKLLPTIQNLIDRILPIIQTLLAQITPLIMGIIDSLVPLIEGVIDVVMPMINSVLDMVVPMIEELMPVIMGVINEITPVINEIIALLLSSMPYFKQFSQAIVLVFKGAMDIVMPIIKGVVKIFGQRFKHIVNQIKNVISIVKNLFSGDFGGAIDSFQSLVLSGIGNVKDIFDSVVGIVDDVIAKISEKFPFIGSILEGVKATIQPIIDNIQGIFSGMIDFVTGIFTGDWEQAWNGVKSIFSNIFDGLANIIKVPLNGVIGIVNKVIGSINGMGFTIPDWVPVVGGKEFSLNIPEIPTFAKGGIASTPSICGEGGYPEWVITPDPAYRQRNIGLLSQAADALDVKAGGSKGGNTIKIEFAPVINCPSGNSVDIMQAIKARMPEFVDMITRALEAEAEGAY